MRFEMAEERRGQVREVETEPKRSKIETKEKKKKKR